MVDAPDSGPRGAAGFTLIELMVVVGIVAILSALAAPALQQMVAQQRIRSATSALNESLWVARGEALKRNDNVSFAFTTAATGWDVKWGATTLLHQDGFSTVSSVLSAGSDGVFAFNAAGRLRTPQSIELSSPVSSNLTQCVTVSTSGKATVRNGTCP